MFLLWLAEDLCSFLRIFSFGSGYEIIPFTCCINFDVCVSVLCLSALWYIILACYSRLGILLPRVFLMVSFRATLVVKGSCPSQYHRETIRRVFCHCFSNIKVYILSYCLSISCYLFSLLLFTIYHLSFLCLLWFKELMVSVFYGWLVDICDELNVRDLGNITTIYFFELNPQKITREKALVRLFCGGVGCLPVCIYLLRAFLFRFSLAFIVHHPLYIWKKKQNLWG